MDKFLKKADVNRSIPAGHRKRKRDAAGVLDGSQGAADSLDDDSLGDDALISACDEAERSATVARPASCTSSSSAPCSSARSSHEDTVHVQKQPQQALLGAASVRSSTAQRAAWAEELQRCFLVPFPDDFFDLWDLACELKPHDPAGALHPMGVALVGPYDLLAGRACAKEAPAEGKWHRCDAGDGSRAKCEELSAEQLLVHWRYFFDPPEMLTVLTTDRAGKGGDDGLHWGYWRDDPADMPVGVVSCHPRRVRDTDGGGSGGKRVAMPGSLHAAGSNLFAALQARLDAMSEAGAGGLSSADQASLRRIQRSLTRRAEQGDLALDAGEAGGGSSWRSRKSKIVAPVFHGLGLVVPFDKEADVGWRPLPESDRDLKRAWSRVQDSEPRRRDTSPLDEIVTWATIANDECDFGMGLQLGHDLLAWERQDGAGKHVLSSYIEQIMPISYMLLDRMPFMEVLTAHLKHRYRERRSAVGLGL